MIRELTSEIITMVKFATIQPLVSFVFNHEFVKDNVVFLIVFLMGFYFVTQIDINWLYHHVILRLYYNKVCSYSYNQVEISGERILRHGMYSSSSNIVTSSSFQAMWEYLQENRNKSVFDNIGDGAVYFGWLGVLIAGIAIASDGFMSNNSEDLGPAVAMMLHPLFYGYFVRLITRVF